MGLMSKRCILRDEEHPMQFAPSPFALLTLHISYPIPCFEYDGFSVPCLQPVAFYSIADVDGSLLRAVLKIGGVSSCSR